MKLFLRTFLAALVASAVTWIAALLGISAPFSPWTDRAPPGLVQLGWNLGVFFVLCLVGYFVLRLLLRRGKGSTWAYLLGGAAVGVAAAVLTVLMVEPDLALRPWLLLTGALAGLLGGLPISGSGSERAVLTPVERDPAGRG